MNRFLYYIPLISLVIRIYHFLRRDEDISTRIDRNLDCAVSNLALTAILLIFEIFYLIFYLILK